MGWKGEIGVLGGVGIRFEFYCVGNRGRVYAGVLGFGLGFCCFFLAFFRLAVSFLVFIWIYRSFRIGFFVFIGCFI